MKESKKEKENNKNNTKESDLNKEKELKKKYLKTLVILIIALVIVDVISLIYYYKPNISFNFGNSNKDNNSNNLIVKEKKCEDGTLFNSCSTNKPLYCYEGQLLKKAATCSCPSGYKVNFQDCVKV